MFHSKQLQFAANGHFDATELAMYKTASLRLPNPLQKKGAKSLVTGLWKRHVKFITYR